MYRRYQEDPRSVGESWQEFFADYRPPRRDGARRPRQESAAEPISPDGTEKPAPAAEKPAAVAASVAPDDLVDLPEGASPLRGVAARIAANMEASLGVPTATSVRTVPGKLLEENRRVINRYLAGHVGGKVSFTHIIGFAILRALEARPAMKASYVEREGKPYVVQHKHVNFGLAVDMERDNGSRTLYVPNIKEADELEFSGFWEAYEDLIRKVRENKLTTEDFSDTTVTLTNPGTVGTRLSVPRLMPMQGVIVGTGALDYPPEYEAADPRSLARLGVGKVLTITSTYDHRVIQGAESGEFLAQIHRLLLGEDRFYDEIFSSLRIPYEPVRWSRDLSAGGDLDAELDKQARVSHLVNMYRVRGHLLAELNPIGWEVLSHRELDLSYHGLTVWDLDREFLTEGLPEPPKQPLREIVDRLRDAYCRTVGIEYMHISDPEQKHWIQHRAEETPTELSRDAKIHVLDRLNAAEAFERFLHSKYMGHKRFSLEGAESTIPMLDTLLEEAGASGVIEVVMGMSHRGRLNVLANIVGKPLKEIFKEFEGSIDPASVQGSGDVKYHLGMTGRFKSRDGTELGVVLASNPSHLEAVDPVVEGMARAKQDVLGSGSGDRVLPVLLHGDAAFAGQGVVAETLNMSALPGYKVGGTVHLVINNNIGFTTSPAAGRSTTYATDIAKMVQAPIFHVNGDDPEACVRVMRLAFAYRKTFKRDVVVDLVCYRKYGHNEGDEPGFTQPLMYAKIEEHRSVRKLYTESLLNRGELTLEEAEQTFEDFNKRLQDALRETREAAPPPDTRAAKPPAPMGVLPPVETGVERERLELVHKKLTSFPAGFEPHPKLKKLIEKRGPMLERDAIDWSAGEALAFGSLVLEGIPVRLSGQDSRRGTFSQRHSVLVDYRSGDEYAPLNDLAADQAPFRAYDSLLSEFGAMGFEYGYSVANGDALVCWEAQFGDFVNEAQVIVDQFIVAGEDKWDQASGLVLLLPHGFEGQGPEHSSARLERFLTLAAEDSIQLTQPTTPAQYFHVLRRQMVRSIRKPLVVMTPKSLLRNPRARSATSDLVEGHFRETMDDDSVEQPESVQRILFCSGKIAYDLKAQRDERNAPVAVVRVEQLYPFPHGQLLEIFERYPNATGLRWVQEEPENMGAWFFMRQWLARRLPERLTLDYVARPESASPATGSARVHEQEEEDIFEAAFS
ncbi:MAG: multifunctional oxoglutarate decarboxylase/oxoglutarate dehydrogenase thiamine pyrophosphate-binding subunit/dihydrolipoyllysine-residue succinyltransferase subunit [Actinomycetota bacterium]|nr:multifunctional oxoglutarate decarboxylase/oxoglutarate dehydrogenase thiamine pyrophosphate-binding subunit/dihydrolipoyllysine-residue succinyltransferase subunit [Actinomycetota bacterium]